MNEIPSMSSGAEIYIPTEVVLQIVSKVDRSLSGYERQRTLYNICLISRQWYSAALSFLYSRPRLEKGNAYKKFTAVLCPPVGAPKTSKDLGNLIHRLDLGRLVHHSSNSMTARLIGRVKENMEIFIAPAAGFSVNCLAPLSKCTKLQYLDLSLVNESFTFDSIIKTIRSMRQLVTFRAPRFMQINEDMSSIRGDGPKWPPSLENLLFSGTLAIGMGTFWWPQNMNQLSLKYCVNLCVEEMAGILESLQLNRKLKHLTISTYNRGLRPECIHLVPAFLPNLLFLSIPGDLVQEMFFVVIQHQKKELALQVLEFGHTHTGEKFDFSVQSIIDLLDTRLPHLRAVGFHNMYGEHPDLDDALQKRAEDMDEDELYFSEEPCEFDFGTYYFD